MGKFTFTQTEIPGVVVIEPEVFGDDRGYFMETYKKGDFAAAGIDREFVQDNQSRSSRGVLRGLHFQKQHTQGKLVRVTLGEVYDVAVDCRPHSATFGKWVGVTLSAENKKMFYIRGGHPLRRPHGGRGMARLRLPAQDQCQRPAAHPLCTADF